MPAGSCCLQTERKHHDTVCWCTEYGGGYNNDPGSTITTLHFPLEIQWQLKLRFTFFRSWYFCNRVFLFSFAFTLGRFIFFLPLLSLLLQNDGQHRHESFNSLWPCIIKDLARVWSAWWVARLNFMVQRNLSVTTTSLIKFITCDLFSNVF